MKAEKDGREVFTLEGSGKVAASLNVTINKKNINRLINEIMTSRNHVHKTLLEFLPSSLLEGYDITTAADRNKARRVWSDEELQRYRNKRTKQNTDDTY